jgi:ribosome-associated translation inhibitor RaiA
MHAPTRQVVFHHTMLTPLQISLHGVAPSNALVLAIRERATWLERFCDRMTSCRVALALEGRHQRQGRQFSVHIGIKVPHGEIAVTREHDQNVRIALREAFDAARRQLEDYARETRRDVKRPAPG